MSEEKVTTTKCPQCGNKDLVRLGTMNLKVCTDCQLDIPWYVEQGQPALFGGQTQEERK